MKFICKRKQKKVFSLFLTLALVFTLMSHLALAASAETLETTVSSSLTHTTKAISTITAVNVKSTNAVATMYHVKGTASTRSMAGTYYFNAAQSLTSPKFADTFASHATQLGLSYQRQMLASDKVVCNISSGSKTGTYNVHVWWTGMQWNQKVFTTYTGGNNVDQNRTIAFVPHTSSYVYYAAAELP